MRLKDGAEVVISGCQKTERADNMSIFRQRALHYLRLEKVIAEIDWARRHKLMRMHSCLHLLCAIVDGGVTGGQVGEEKPIGF